MAIRSKTINGITLLAAYLRHHKLMSAIGLYFGIGMVLELFFSIDLLVPCLWDSIFGFRCPGCGLTTACMELLSLDFRSAWQENPLIFVVLPVGLYFIFWDIRKFNRSKTLQEKS